VALAWVVAGGSPTWAQPDPEAKKAGPPKLVVLLVFDQFRADYLTRWQDLFGSGDSGRSWMAGPGFRRKNRDILDYVCRK
jgi:hypothetical protein